MVKEITVQELKNMRDQDKPHFLLDVREQHEKDFSDIGGTLIPLGQLQARTEELEKYKDSEVIIYCRSGARSAEACRILMLQGFASVSNLAGGILKWSDEIDSSVPRY